MGSFKQAVDALQPERPRDYFLDIADDGYVITGEVEVEEAERLEMSAVAASGSWRACAATSRLGECGDGTCGCSRVRNPTARDGFLQVALRRIRDAAGDRPDVACVSLGCGLLRFDLLVLEGLLAAGVQVTSVHLVDSMYAPDAKSAESHRAALAQFAAWFAGRGVDVYAHASVEAFAFRARSAELLPLFALQVDCFELTAAFESEVKPVLEDVLQYGGVLCALSARCATDGDGAIGSCCEAWGEVWRLCEKSGRLRRDWRTRYRPGEGEGVEMHGDEPLPPVAGH